MCMKYAELEKSLGEIDSARAIYSFSSQFADPLYDTDFWNKSHEFEVQHGDEDTFREMLRMKRSVSANYSQIHTILPEYIMQKDQKLNLEETVDTLKLAGVPEDEMAALERQFSPSPPKDGKRKLGFVSAGVEPQSGVIRTLDGGRKVTTNQEEVDLPSGSDSEDEDRVEIAQKNVPAAVFGDLTSKAAESKAEENDAKLGVERLKRRKWE